MSLPHAILGLIEEEKELTGYDLKTQGFDRRVSHFWSADQAQIYRTLDKLADQGLVEARIEIQQDHPNRKLYRLTEAGRAELRSWQTSHQPLTPNREAFLIQLYFGAELTNAEILALLHFQLNLQQQRLHNYRQIPLPELGDPSLTRVQTMHRLTLECGISRTEAALKWLQQAIATVENLPEKEG